MSSNNTLLSLLPDHSDVNDDIENMFPLDESENSLIRMHTYV